MQLHAINKEKPTKKFVGRKRNITRYPSGGFRKLSSSGKMIGPAAGRKPSFSAFFRSASSKEEGTHFRAGFLVPFLAIFALCATFLMGIHWRSTRGLRADGKREEEEAVVAAEEQ
jgi:hypothetical protein